MFVEKAPLDLSYVGDIFDKASDKKSMFFEKFEPQRSPDIDPNKPMIEQIDERDLFLSYPYESIEDIPKIVRSNPKIAPVLAAQSTDTAARICAVYDQQFDEVIKEYDQIMADYTDYPNLCIKVGEVVKEFPELEGKIELLDCWTPLTYNRYCNAYHGSYMGFVTTVGNKQMRLKGIVKRVNNLFLAGQWVMSPGGLPIAVISGKFAVQRILKRDGKSIEI